MTHLISQSSASTYLDMPISDTDMTSSGGGAWNEEGGGVWREISGDLMQSICLFVYANLLIYTFSLKLITFSFFHEELEKENESPVWVTLKMKSSKWIMVNVEETWTESSIESILRLNSVTPEDAGEISCKAPHATPATATFDVEDKKTPKQHYPGLSKSKLKEEKLQISFPVTSAISGATKRLADNKFVTLCAALLLLFTLTNLALCLHYFRKNL
ncbi:hypothetical protein Anas_06382 [Armadillidium nasatum]|uniref:Ig-like domain-containing protein n=1 Tax=Armadillidium nasatum TaxID=96803 RepID=A0A5N5TJR1_9CRUS|nr:hypothetical protein Anas_06382 [Armadillidium nasatum]